MIKLATPRRVVLPNDRNAKYGNCKSARQDALPKNARIRRRTYRRRAPRDYRACGIKDVVKT